MVSALCFVLVAGCTRDEARDPALVLLDLDRSNPERLVAYYLGGYMTSHGGDPFTAGLAAKHGDRLYLHLDSLQARYPRGADLLSDAAADGRLDWDEFSAFIKATYYDARSVPETLDQLALRYSYARGAGDWFTVDVRGVMTVALRTIYVPHEAVRAALRDYWSNESRLIYPVETAIIGEHRLDGELRETTAMIKRGDGYWDFVTYDAQGELAPATSTPPRSLDSPTQCVGCHFGSRLFEPERSFPHSAPEGPRGVRALYVDEELRDAEVVDFFDEHARRSDTVLGLYGSLFVARLRADRRLGRITTADAELLDSLDL